jgi:hypothetical protein
MNSTSFAFATSTKSGSPARATNPRIVGSDATSRFTTSAPRFRAFSSMP